MLVLSRKPGERIQIGPEIWITLVKLGPNCAKIGIDAPRGLAIAREELVHREAILKAEELIRERIAEFAQAATQPVAAAAAESSPC